MKKNKVEITRMIQGATTTQIVGAAAACTIFDLLYETPLPLETLLDKLPYDRSSMHRLINALIALRLVTQGIHVSITDKGAYLAKKHPESIQALAIYKAHPIFWKPLGFLQEGLQRGSSPFTLAFGCELFDFLDQDTEAAEVFHNAMDCYTKQSSTALLRTYPFHEFHSILDLGGGSGAFGEVLMSLFPSLTYTTFDRKAALKRVRNPKVQTLEGSFFEKIPKGYDLYILRNIIHDWPDKESITILQKAKDALGVDGKLLIIETLVSGQSLGRISDITMAFQTPGGKERTFEEFQSLIEQAGLSITNTVKTTASKAILEVVSSELS